jgi:hypothetical protein
MGAAVKLSGPNSSPWIVDGGSNGGVMKMVGESRQRIGSVGKSIPLIGIAIATIYRENSGAALEKPENMSDADPKKRKISEALNKLKNYDTKGHSHLILAVDRKENFPVKLADGKPAFGYEIEYTKLFEDSLSTVFGVPIVGVLGMLPQNPAANRNDFH